MNGPPRLPCRPLAARHRLADPDRRPVLDPHPHHPRPRHAPPLRPPRQAKAAAPRPAPAPVAIRAGPEPQPALRWTPPGNDADSEIAPLAERLGGFMPVRANAIELLDAYNSSIHAL